MEAAAVPASRVVAVVGEAVKGRGGSGEGHGDGCGWWLRERWWWCVAAGGSVL